MLCLGSDKNAEPIQNSLRHIIYCFYEIEYITRTQMCIYKLPYSHYCSKYAFELMCE